MSANLMQRYADTMNIDVHNLIDYMVVQSALRDVKEEELEYLEAIKSTKFTGFDEETGEPICQRATFVRVLRQTSLRLNDALHPSSSADQQRKARSERTNAFRKYQSNPMMTMMSREKQSSSKGARSMPWLFRSTDSWKG